MNKSKLKTKYIVALSLIALLTVGSQIIIQLSIRRLANDSRIINIAGRQRMLSQKITKNICGLLLSENAADKKDYFDELENAINLWEKSKNGLLHGNEEVGYKINNSKKVLELFDSIENNYKEILYSAKTVNPNTSLNTKEGNEILKIVRENEKLFLKGMDRIVFEYDKESKEKLGKIKIIELLIMLFTIIVLVLEALFIFRPAEKKINESVQDLEREKELTQVANIELEKNHAILKLMNQELEAQKENLILKEKELIEANSTKDKFLSIIAHDMKGPIGSGVQILGLFEEHLKETSKEELLETITHMKDSMKSIYDLLLNLLNWAMFQRGELSYNPKNINIAEVIYESLDPLKMVAELKQININMKVDKDILICADRQMIITVIRNLISNAIKFTYNKGIITLTTEKKPNGIHISISDTGVGMSSSEIKKLFILGEKVSNFGTNNERGTGLGLLLCEDFVKKNNGIIEVQSELGKGSIFRLIFPYSKYSREEGDV